MGVRNGSPAFSRVIRKAVPERDVTLLLSSVVRTSTYRIHTGSAPYAVCTSLLNPFACTPCMGESLLCAFPNEVPKLRKIASSKCRGQLKVSAHFLPPTLGCALPSTKGWYHRGTTERGSFQQQLSGVALLQFSQSGHQKAATALKEQKSGAGAEAEASAGKPDEVITVYKPWSSESYPSSLMKPRCPLGSQASEPATKVVCVLYESSP